MPPAAGVSYLRPPEGRLPRPAERVLLLERDDGDFLAAGFFAAAFLVVVRFFVLVEPPELERLLPGEAAGGGAGVAAGALAEAARVRPPATATNGSKPSSPSAISAPAVIAIAAPRPR